MPDGRRIPGRRLRFRYRDRLPRAAVPGLRPLVRACRRGRSCCRSRCCAGAAGPGRFNARVVHGVVARTGSTVLVADTGGPPADGDEDRVRYQVLCRSHHRSGELGPPATRPDRPDPAGEPDPREVRRSFDAGPVTADRLESRLSGRPAPGTTTDPRAAGNDPSPIRVEHPVPVRRAPRTFEAPPVRSTARSNHLIERNRHGRSRPARQPSRSDQLRGRPQPRPRAPAHRHLPLPP